jgi:hypothetical protein
MSKKPSVQSDYHAKKDRLQISIKHYSLEEVRAQRSDEAPSSMARRKSGARKSKRKEGQTRQAAERSLEGKEIAHSGRLTI